MGAQLFPLLVQEIPRLQGLAGEAGEEGGVISPGHEADVLAVVLAGVEEAVLLGKLPDLGLGQLPQGKANVGKLALGQTGQKIGLILGSVCGLI